MSPYLAVGTAVVCSGPRGIARRLVQQCPTERRPRRMVAVFGGVYYGDTVTCLGCGESWSGGERHERPFRPRWRQEAMAEARRDWSQALTPREYRRAVHHELDVALGRAA